MEIYYYCSYTGSPCGFILGKYAFDSDVTRVPTLSSEKIDPLIERCFEYGVVQKAFGPLLSETNRRFLLVKDLNFRDADNTRFYMNIALVTEKMDQYERWMKKGPSKEAIDELCRQTIVIDRTSKFGFKVDGAYLTKLIDCSFGSLFTPVASNATGEGPFFELSSASADLKEAALDLGLSDSTKELTRVPDGGSWAYLAKKKKSRPSNSVRPHQKHTITQKGKYGLLILAALALLLILTIWSKA